jgi:hypothetical protein
VLQIDRRQFQRIDQTLVRQKIDRAMARAVPVFEEFSAEERSAFVEDSLSGAAAHGLRTEQGLASYALALWFLAPGFEQRSRYLSPLLQSRFPELRKVYAMNEWVHALLGNPADTAGADDRLKQAFRFTHAWGEGQWRTVRRQ